MPVAEIVRLVETLDGSGRSPVGDLAAQAWGFPTATFVRSSASHVFAARGADGRAGCVLRLRPATQPGARTLLARSAACAAALHHAGAAVAAAVPSTAGALVERVGDCWVTAVELVEGPVLDDDDLPTTVAADWGRLVAQLHASAADATLDVAGGLPSLVDLTPPELATSLAGLSRTPDVYGVLHGDPEPDNVVQGRDGLVLVDLDDVRRGWFAADIAFALRAWASPAGAPDLSAPVPAAFLAGYRQVRPVSHEELSWMPLLARASAAEKLRQLAPVLAERPSADWPAWALAVDRKVRARAQEWTEALRRDGG